MRPHRRTFWIATALYFLADSALGDTSEPTLDSAEYTRQIVSWSKRVTAASQDAEFWVSAFVDATNSTFSARDAENQDCESDLLAFSVELQLRPKLCLYLGNLQGATKESLSGKRNVVAALRSAAELIDGEVILLDIGDGSIGTLAKGGAGVDWSDTLAPLWTRLQASSATLDLVVVEQEGADAPWLADLLDTLADCCLTIRSVIMTIGAFSQQPVCTETWKAFRSKSKWGAHVPSQDFEVVTLPGCRSQILLLRLEAQPKRIERSSDWPASERLATVQFVSSRCDREVEFPDGTRMQVCSKPPRDGQPPWLLLRGDPAGGCVALEKHQDGAHAVFSLEWEMGFAGIQLMERHSSSHVYQMDLFVDGERVLPGYEFTAAEKKAIFVRPFTLGSFGVAPDQLQLGDAVHVIQLSVSAVIAGHEEPLFDSRLYSLHSTLTDRQRQWRVCDDVQPRLDPRVYNGSLQGLAAPTPDADVQLDGACVPTSALRSGLILHIMHLVPYAGRESTAAYVDMGGVSMLASPVSFPDRWRVEWPARLELPTPGEHHVRMDLVDRKGEVVAAAEGFVCVAADGEAEDPFYGRMHRAEGAAVMACAGCLAEPVKMASNVCAACYVSPFAHWMPAAFGQDLLRFAVAKTAAGTSTFDCHGLTAMMLIRMAKARRVLEIGCYWGDSSLFLLLGVAALDGDRWLQSVDLFQCPFVPPKDLRRLWTMTTSDALDFLEGQADDAVFDLVYLDDTHHSPHVARELQLLRPHLHSDSIVLIHDTMASTKPFYNFDKEEMPSPALLQLPPSEWEFATFPVCHGLTLLRRTGTG